MIISFIILSIMKTASSLNGPMTHIDDEYNLFPVYSNCLLVKWFHRNKQLKKSSSDLSTITVIDPFTITSF